MFLKVKVLDPGPYEALVNVRFIIGVHPDCNSKKRASLVIQGIPKELQIDEDYESLARRVEEVALKYAEIGH